MIRSHALILHSKERKELEDLNLEFREQELNNFTPRHSSKTRQNTSICNKGKRKAWSFMEFPWVSKPNNSFRSTNVTLLHTNLTLLPTNNCDTQQTSFWMKSTPPLPLHSETMHTAATSRVLVAAAVEQIVPGRLHRCHLTCCWNCGTVTKCYTPTCICSSKNVFVCWTCESLATKYFYYLLQRLLLSMPQA